MALSKKTRFEVFKRDGFKCAYCGQTPPVVVLEVDHINPKSRGGEDDINNLITACFDCNRGKTNVPLSSIPKQLKDNLDEIKEREAQLKEYRKSIKKIERRVARDIEDINKVYEVAFPGWELSDNFKSVTVKRFLSLLPKHEIIESLQMAISRLNDRNTSIRYFCGICWNKIRSNQE